MQKRSSSRLLEKPSGEVRYKWRFGKEQLLSRRGTRNVSVLTSSDSDSDEDELDRVLGRHDKRSQSLAFNSTNHREAENSFTLPQSEIGFGTQTLSGDHISSRDDNFDVEMFHDEAASRQSKVSSITVSSGGEEYCWVCGAGDMGKELIQCDGCAAWIHLRCYNENKPREARLKAVPLGEFFCTSKEECGKELQNLLDLGLVSLTGTYKRSRLDEEFDQAQQRENVDERINSGRLARGAQLLYKVRLKNPMTYASMCMWSKHLHGLNPDDFRHILDAFVDALNRESLNLSEHNLSRLRNLAPPINIRRCIERCSKKSHQETLITSVNKNIEAFFVLNFLDPYEAAFDLFTSRILRNAGPMYAWNDSRLRCMSGRLGNFSEKVRSYCKVNELDPDSKEILVLCVNLYCDDSVSKSANTKACPMWLTITAIDPAVRVSNEADAHVLLSLFPVSTGIDFRFKQGAQAVSRAHPRSAAHCTTAKLEKLANDLKLMAYEKIFESVKKYENTGKLFEYQGRIVRLHLIVVGMVVDMKERRFVLQHRKNLWHCMSCYDFPGKDSLVRYGKRTSRQDAKFREAFNDGDQDVVVQMADPTGKKTKTGLESKKVRFNEAYGEFGITLIDKCPLSSSDKNAIFVVEGASEIFPADLLHNKDGVILRVMKLLKVRLGANFVKETQVYGNDFLSTKRFAMHVMERGIESFHFIPIAIWFGKFSNEVTQEEGELLFTGTCHLLNFISLLNDQSPFLLIDRMKSSLKEFKRFVNQIILAIEKTGQVAPRITTKMHELFEHVLPQLKSFGYMPSYSSKLYETFHEVIFGLMKSSSSNRLTDGSGTLEVLLAVSYRQLVREAQFLSDDGSKFQRNSADNATNWKAVPKFDMAEVKGKLIFAEAFASNFESVCELLSKGNSSPNSPLEVSSMTPSCFGNTLEMWLECEIRKTRLSTIATCVVPGTGMGMYRSGGALNVLAYYDGKTEETMRCSVPQCSSFEHDHQLQLFCSAYREKNTNYGIPIIFADGHAWIVPLKKVKDKSDSFPDNPVLEEMTFNFEEILMINFTSIRGVSMSRLHHSRSKSKQGRIFVFLRRGVFGHEGL